MTPKRWKCRPAYFLMGSHWHRKSSDLQMRDNHRSAARVEFFSLSLALFEINVCGRCGLRKLTVNVLEETPLPQLSVSPTTPQLPFDVVRVKPVPEKSKIQSLHNIIVCLNPGRGEGGGTITYQRSRHHMWHRSHRHTRCRS